MAEQDLRVQLTPAGLKEVIDALRQVRREAADTTNKTKTLFDQIRSRVGGLLPTIGISAVGTAFGFLVTRITEFQDAMGKGAARVGASVENFSALAFAAKTADASIEEVEAGLGRLARNVSEFQRGGGEAKDTFEALGLSARTFAGKDTVEAFEEVAKTIGGMPAGIDKTRAAIELLGRGGAKLIPLLNDIAEKGFAQVKAEAESFGAVVRGETAEAAQKFNDDLERMTIASGKAGRSLVAELLPALTEVSGAIALAAKEGGLLAGVWAALGGAAALALGKTDSQKQQRELEDTVANVAALEAQVNKYRETLERGAFAAKEFAGITLQPEVKLSDRQINAMNAELFLNVKLLDEAKRKLADLQAARAAPAKKPGAGGADGDFRVDAQKRVAELTKQIGGEQLKQLDDLQKKRDAIATLEVQNVQRTAELRATTQAQQDRIEVEALTRREQLIKQSYQTDIQAAQAKEQALAALVARTTPKGRTANELQAAIAKQSFDEQLNAATSYYQKLSTLQEQYVARYKQSQDRIKSLDEELANSRLERERIIANATRSRLTEEQRAEADLARLREARAELGGAVIRGAGDEVRKLNTEVNELFARLASTSGFENVARRLSDESQGLFETFLKVEKSREQALGKEAADKIKATNTELEKTKALSTDLAKQSALTIKPTVDQAGVKDLRDNIQKSLDEKPFRINVQPNVSSGGSSTTQLAHGGVVPGISPHQRADDKLALVTSGEFVHQVAAVRHYGIPFMRAVNDRQFPRYAAGGIIDDVRTIQNVVPFVPVQRFADGGIVRDIQRAATDEARDTVNVNLSLGGETVQVRTDREEARRLVRMLQNVERGVSRR